MRALISLVLIAGIYLSYVVIDKLVGEEVDSPKAGLEFNEYDASLKKLKPIRDYSDIAERPLFDEDRVAEKKAIKKVKKVTPRPVVDDLRVQALGVALSSDGILAVIKDLKVGKTVRIRIDEEIHGWKLVSVAKSKFTFSKHGKEKVIYFKNDRGS